MAKLHNNSLCFHLLQYKDNRKKMGRRRLGLSFRVCLGNRGGVIKDVYVRKTILIIPFGILLLSVGHDSFFKLFLKSKIK
jgi:hypothetical protein